MVVAVVDVAELDASLRPCRRMDDHTPLGSDYSLEMHLVDSYCNFGKDNFAVAVMTEKFPNEQPTYIKVRTLIIKYHHHN